MLRITFTFFLAATFQLGAQRSFTYTPETVIVTSAAGAVTFGEIEAVVTARSQKLLNDYYNIVRMVAVQALDDRMLQLRARSLGLTVEAMLEHEMLSKARRPTAEEVAVLIEQQPGAPRTSEQVIEEVYKRRVAAQRVRLMAGLRTELELKFNIQPPRISVETEASRSWGPRTAPLQLAVFSDFQCPYCVKSVDVIRQLKSRYGDRLAVSFVNFPLGIHPQAREAAAAATCASQQGRFWELHDLLFANNSQLSRPFLDGLAGQANLEAGRFKSCMDDPATAKSVDQEVKKAEALGISGTPTFYLNGRLVSSGHAPIEHFEALIKEENVLQPTATSEARR